MRRSPETFAVHVNLPVRDRHLDRQYLNREPINCSESLMPFAGSTDPRHPQTISLPQNKEYSRAIFPVSIHSASATSSFLWPLGG
jgi:hypothetical protein